MIPRRLRRGLASLLFLGLAFSSALPLRADDPALDAKTLEILGNASGFYADLSSFQADGSNVLKNNHPELGIKMEATETFSIAMSRPDSFAFVKKSGVGSGGMLLSNGKTTAAYVISSVPNGNKKEYLLAPAPPELSELLTTNTQLSYGRVLVNTALFEALLAKYPFGPLVNRWTSGTYVGPEKIGEIPAEHVRLTSILRERKSTTDLWFASGQSPFLVQASWALDSQTGNTLTFSNWRTNEALSTEQFEFHPPEDATRVTDFSMPTRKEEPPPWVKVKPTP